MHKNSKLQILSNIFGKYEPHGKEYLFFCPYCNHHKRKLSINLEKNVFKCWTCQKKGSDIFFLIKRFGTYEHVLSWKQFGGKTVDIAIFDKIFGNKEITNKEIPLPSGYISLINNNDVSSRNARDYLARRNVFHDDIVLWKIGYCDSGTYSERIIIPSFDRNGILNYFVGRTYVFNPKKYLNPPFHSNEIIFNELNLDFKKDLVVVEGAFDAIIAGQNSVPLLGSTLNTKSRLFQKIVKFNTPLFIALDEDALLKELKIIKSLLEYGIEIYKIPIDKESDVGGMTKNEFEERKNDAILIDNNNILWYETQLKLRGK